MNAVIFFGADGTGKSTQATILLKAFRREGLKARKVWIRARHSLAYTTSQLLLRLGYRSILTLQNNSVKILDPRPMTAKWVWSFLEFISVLPWILIRFYLPLFLGYRVVAERYVIDTVVYNEYFIGDSFNNYAKILLRMIPKDSLLIHVYADKRDLLKRREGDILSEDFMDYQLKRYRRLAGEMKALGIDTSKNSIPEVSRIIAKACESNQRDW